MDLPLAISELKQKDNYSFSIIWNNGKEHSFRLSDLQKRCPCANCMDENTKHFGQDQRIVQPDVRAFVIRLVGRYGLEIKFTTGCSMGIYSFDWLHQLGEHYE
ncbi:MAG: DUF971 domain-containing protein [Candidatus Protochlamydia sp.]|nr:DUF971 domain-containing protein [Candidatus Protochlamydia sp.]